MAMVMVMAMALASGDDEHCNQLFAFIIHIVKS